MRRSGRSAALSGHIPTKGENQAIVKNFSAQPPLRIASLGTMEWLAENIAIMKQVCKYLHISALYVFRFLETFMPPKNYGPSYRNGAFIQLRWSCHPT
jgi:hypothetical protein